MGSVWIAEDSLLERLVAVKFIAHAEPDRATRERFAIEARAAARLQHPNVVTVHRYGEISGRPYLVSEFIRGDALDKLVKPVPWMRALEIGVALARGLGVAHRHGIIHRDIKPANAILAADGEAKLVDFGLAKLERHDVGEREKSSPYAAGSPLSQAGAIAGTPRYLAPEVRAGDPASRRSDVYQLGEVLYELVTGRAPLVDLMERPTDPSGPPGEPSLDPPPLFDRLRASDGNATHVARFAAVVDRCLRRDPSRRYASGDELREALEQVVPGRATAELPEGNPYRGLASFEAEHRGLFFGREPEIRAVIERVRAESFVVVTGDSGVGKSSLCRAGVLPRIAETDAWAVVQLVPGQHPLATLAALVAEALGADEEALAAALRTPGAAARELRRACGARRGLAVFVDQLEELVTLTERDERDTFAAVLAELATSPRLRLLATVRSDFLTRVAELPAIGAEIGRAIYLLRPLSPEGAREAIVEPANAAGGRFESAELVATLVTSVAELPLLAFTLAQLWEARDRDTGTISARSLEAIGGVKAALARHADGVLEHLLPAQRAAARTLLLRLVTAERTRVRATAEGLAAFDRSALDALVRGRLVVARGAAAPTYELAHERLIDGWPALAGWISENSEAIAAHRRLAAATAEWERLGRAREGLLDKRRLGELAIVPREDLTSAEHALVRASHRAIQRRRWLRGGLAITVIAVIALLYVGAKVVARRDLDRHIAARRAEAAQRLAQARDVATASGHARTAALERFDAGDAERGETAWRRVQELGDEARAHYVQASRALEEAYLLDTSRDGVREELVDVLRERIALADRDYRRGERDELAQRLAVYEPVASARLVITKPPGTTATVLDATAQAPATYLPDGALAAGSYIIDAPPIRVPIFLRPGEHRTIDVTPPAIGVPQGYVYIPRGKFLFGSDDDETIRAWLGTTPMHEVETGPYFIARTEVTYADWIAFLEKLPPDERARRTPRLEAAATYRSGSLELRTLPDGARELTITPDSVTYTAREGEPIIYRARTLRRQQDWRRFPVSGVSPQDAEAYAAWLSRTGTLPRARLCTEHEWERAARGVDGRRYPNGARIEPGDANIDATYGRRDGAYGPDEVGSHPRSTSPYGLADTAGNVWDITRSVGGALFGKGGTFYQSQRAAHLANRDLVAPAQRHIQLGVRMCADVP